MNACPVVSADRRYVRRYRVERDDLSRPRLAPAPHGPSFPSACFTWASLRVILLVFERGCFQFDGLRLCGREIPARTLLGPSRRSATPHIYSDSINTCISFLDSTAPTAIVLLGNHGPSCHSVVSVAVVVNVAVIGICGSQRLRPTAALASPTPNTAPASC
ncbi:hypothetical protein C8R45DRAFT_1007887 [Mycena sanguinolenta]|nr:hypothetical protein C8R45DRAFT_1007887 [Mycena sanguinolenta]